ncbi:MAG: branched-chain amino acid ABC transporter permease [Hyphomicrobiales bacterium]|jgi:branched-chain amino acid transport system permease protein|nr:branched-chain amino acid ABC transporter permease [Hyphomicrobiales bacterium]
MEADIRFFLTVTLNGLTLAALYFLVASGFTLVFGLMRVLNLAHGVVYLFGAYVGFDVMEATGSWTLAIIVGGIAGAVFGLLVHVAILSWMPGQELRQTLATIAVSVIAADLMIAKWGGLSYQIEIPDILFGSQTLPLVGRYPIFRLALLGFAVGVGFLLWLMLNRTRLGMMIRAGVDDRDMLAAMGTNVPAVFIAVATLGAFLAGVAGVIGGSALAISPGEDTRVLLSSLVVVIVGGLGSVGGAALGAILVGLAEQYGLAYTPTYGVVYTFAIMVAVLAMRPQGLFGARA